MKVGLTGFAGVGKTTVFTALTGLEARPAGAAAVTLGVIKVPDPRVDKLAEVYAPKKQTYAEVTFVDFPPARTTERRAVLDAPTVAQLRDADALVEVVRAFPDVTGAPATPAEDVGAFGAELVLADLAVVEKRLERLRKEKGNERKTIRAPTAMSGMGTITPARSTITEIRSSATTPGLPPSTSSAMRSA